MKCTLALLFALVAPAAYAAPWLCLTPEGTRVFSYDAESAGLKNCVDHPIPSANVFREKPRGEAPAAFPKVDARTQQSRDTGRRAILERELADERKALTDAMKQLAEQRERHGKNRNAAVEVVLKPYHDRVRVHLTNISNLEKELGREG